MTLNYIWWLGSTSGDLGNMQCLLIAITLRSTLIQSNRTCYGSIYGSTRFVCKLFLLDKNTWYYITRLFELRIVTWSYNCLRRYIIISYLKPYNCKLFVLRIITWSYNCFRKIIIISYLILYNCKLFEFGIVTWTNNFFTGPGDLGSIPGRVIPKTQKMVLDASLLNTQHYKVRIKGKVEPSREGVAPSPTSWCSSYRKGSLRVTLDYGRQLINISYLKLSNYEQTNNLLNWKNYKRIYLYLYYIGILETKQLHANYLY